MTSKDEIERKKSLLRTLRLTVSPFLFVVFTILLSGVFGAPFWPSVLIGCLLSGAAYVAFSLMLNRWAGL